MKRTTLKDRWAMDAEDFKKELTEEQKRKEHPEKKKPEKRRS